MDWLIALLVALAAIAVALVAYLVARVLLQLGESRARSVDSCAEELRSGGTSEEQSRGFVGLLSLGAVPIHTITNKGQSYDDAKQSRVFRSGLTAERITALMRVEGVYR